MGAVVAPSDKSLTARLLRDNAHQWASDTFSPRRQVMLDFDYDLPIPISTSLNDSRKEVGEALLVRSGLHWDRMPMQKVQSSPS